MWRRKEGLHTYKVLSLGMWLKLATDSRLMLLLLRVLREREREIRRSADRHVVTSDDDRSRAGTRPLNDPPPPSSGIVDDDEVQRLTAEPAGNRFGCR